MDELENPFRPGAGTPPPALVGHDELISKFRVTAGRAVRGRPGKSVMPIGLRGVGKTVLLNEFIHVAEQEGLRIGYIEAPETGDLRRLLATRLRTILLDLDRAGKVSRTAKRALGALRSFTYNLPDGSSISVNVDALAGVADSGELADDLTDLLVEVGNAAVDRRTGIVLAIDEVQYLSSDALGALISAIHRTTQLNLPVVLVGAGLPQLPGLSGEAKSYAERLFEFPHIGPLADSDAREVLRIPVAEQGVTFTDDALALLIDRTGGYPYFLQEWATKLGTSPTARRSHEPTSSRPHRSSNASSTRASSSSGSTASPQPRRTTCTRWRHSARAHIAPATSPHSSASKSKRSHHAARH